MRGLIIGADSRTDAIEAIMSADSRFTKVYVIGENAGVRRRGSAEIVKINPLDPYAILNFAGDNGIDLTIPNPEAVIATGIGNLFRRERMAIACPTIEGFLETEGSKCRTMRNAAAGDWWPTRSHHAAGDRFAAESHVRYMQSQYQQRIIKKDGLEGGKGVEVCSEIDSALRSVRALYEKDHYQRLLIDSYVPGRELSATMFVNTANHFKPFQLVAFTGDCKPRSPTDPRNTGGMGAYGAVPGCGIDSRIYAWTERLARQYVYWMLQQEIPDNGVVYFGLKGAMPNTTGLEINRRIGSPEGEVLARLHGSKLIDLFLASANNQYSFPSVNPDAGCCVLVVICNQEYPDKATERRVVRGIEEAERDPRVAVYHAGTTLQNDGTLVATGGRVVMVTCTGSTFEEARGGAYAAVDQIIRDSDPGLDCRRDIAENIEPVDVEDE